MMETDQPKPEGFRERKRRETRRRIAETALRLFIANGYEATTLEAVAEAAGISPRTFFYYFKSKEEILLGWQDGLAEEVRAAVLAEAKQQSPLDTARSAMLKLMQRYDSGHAMAIHGLLRSTEQLRAGKQAKYARQEQVLFEALCELWPQPERRNELRTVAMVSVGALRLAIDGWAEEGGQRPVTAYIEEAFASLKVLL